MNNFNWVTDDTRKFMSKGYLTGQSVEERCLEVSNSFFHNLTSMGLDTDLATKYSNNFFSHLAQGNYSLSTPVWVAYGNDRGLPVSCYNSHVEDSMDAILYAASEVGMLTKLGGGTSAYLGDIRPRGTPITDNGTADGPAHFARVFNTMMQVTRQGSRRGYLAAYLPIEHPDAEEFIQIGSDGSDIQNINTGMTFTDKFLYEAIEDDAKASLLAKFHKGRDDKGYPYALFVDNANNALPQWYKDQGYKIKSSNLCVSGETQILTSEGYKPIHALVGTTVDCWNGTDWSPTPIFQTSEGQKVLEVTLSNLTKIKATPYHKWYVMDGYSKVVEKRTNELTIGDKLIKFDLEPVTHGSKILDLAYVNGFHSGDGTVYKESNKPRISLHDEKQTLLPRFTEYYSSSYTKDGRILNLQYKANVLKDKFFVPSSEYSVESRLLWLAGYFDADGTLTNNDGTESIQVASIELEFIQHVLLLLQELGIHSAISKIKDAGYSKLPANDGSEQLKEYWTKPAYKLLIAGSELHKLLDLGYCASRIIPTKRAYQREARQFIKVLSIVDNDEVIPTYCGTEPKYNKLMFNGVLTGNCNEIMLPSTEDESYVCVLSSMNLVNYDNWKDTDAVFLLTLFLDTVVEESINKLRKLRLKQKYHFLDRIERFLVRHRALGLGVLGWHHLLQSKMLPFASREAAKLNVEIFKYLRQETYAASRWMANTFGEPEVLKGYGMRNTTTMAIAPTKSSSFILGNVSEGIQPEMANCYISDLSKDTLVVRNPYLKEWLSSINKDTDEIWDAIKANSGSLPTTPEFDFIPENVRQVFLTMAEIDQMAIIDQAAARQPYIDQGQSLNLLFHPSTSAAQINYLFYYSWKMGIKGWYYQIPMSAAQAHNVKVINSRSCSACEG